MISKAKAILCFIADISHIISAILIWKKLTITLFHYDPIEFADSQCLEIINGKISYFITAYESKLQYTDAYLLVLHIPTSYTLL